MARLKIIIKIRRKMMQYYFRMFKLTSIIYFERFQESTMTLLWFLLLSVILIFALAERKDQIINGRFTDPGLPQGYLFRFYGREIKGWSCSKHCQITNCTRFSEVYPNFGEQSLDCSGYVIDLNSNGVNEILSQVLSLQANYYWLQFDYFFPEKNSNRKWLQIVFNQNLVSSLQTTLPRSMERFHFKEQVLARDGTNILLFKNNGFYEDASGFKISNVSLYQQSNTLLQSTLNRIFQSHLLQKSSSVPGGRVFFFSLLSFMVNFDRLEFYLYHNRQYSLNLKLFLTKIKDLQSVKGSIVETQIRAWFPSFVAGIESFVNSSSMKMAYISYKIDDQDQKHQTLPYYIKGSLSFSIPIILIIFLCLHFAFRLLQKWYISIVIRPYAFYTTLIFVVLEGSIEQLTFYGLGELRSLCSFNFEHRLINIISLLSIFFVLFTCFGLYLWLKAYYQKKAKIVTDAKYSTLTSLLSMSFDRGMVIFLLGLTHQMLLNAPTSQLFILLSIQIGWIIKKIYSRQCYHNFSLFLISIFQSILRVYFQLTTFIFQIKQQYRDIINDHFHIYFIFGFIVMIGLNILICFYCIAKDIISSPFCRNNKVENGPQSKESEVKAENIFIPFKDNNQDCLSSQPSSRMSFINLKQRRNQIASFTVKNMQTIISNNPLRRKLAKAKSMINQEYL